MRRNCSHCDIEQVVNEEKLSAGWIFVKCHACGEVSTLSGSAWKNAEGNTEQKIATKLAEKKVSVKADAVKTEIAKTAAAPKVIQPPKVTIQTSSAPQMKINQMKIKKRENVRGMFKSNLLPVSLALICVGSGFYILDTINRIKESSPIAITAEAVADKTSERAPQKVIENNTVPTAAAEQTLAADQSGMHPTISHDVNRSPAIVDRIDLPTQAAPIPPEAGSLDQARRSVDGPAIVVVRAKSALLRSGPGQGYMAVGNANVADKFILKGSKMVSNQNWLQVQSSKGLLWIRADLVNYDGGEGSTQ